MRYLLCGALTLALAGCIDIENSHDKAASLCEIEAVQTFPHESIATPEVQTFMVRCMHAAGFP